MNYKDASQVVARICDLGKRSKSS